MSLILEARIGSGDWINVKVDKIGVAGVKGAALTQPVGGGLVGKFYAKLPQKAVAY